MNALDLYINTVYGVRDFWRGITDIHSYAKRERGVISGARALGRMSTAVGYVTVLIALAGRYGPEGFLLLALPASTNIKSYMRQRESERIIQEAERIAQEYEKRKDS